MQRTIARIIAQTDPAPPLPADHIWKLDQLINEAGAFTASVDNLMMVLLHHDYHERIHGRYNGNNWQLWLRLAGIHERAAARYARRVLNKRKARA